MWDYQSAAVRRFFMLEATRRRCMTDVPARPLVDPGSWYRRLFAADRVPGPAAAGV